MKARAFGWNAVFVSRKHTILFFFSHAEAIVKVKMGKSIRQPRRRRQRKFPFGFLFWD